MCVCVHVFVEPHEVAKNFQLFKVYQEHWIYCCSGHKFILIYLVVIIKSTKISKRLEKVILR